MCSRHGGGGGVDLVGDCRARFGDGAEQRCVDGLALQDARVEQCDRLLDAVELCVGARCGEVGCGRGAALASGGGADVRREEGERGDRCCERCRCEHGPATAHERDEARLALRNGVLRLLLFECVQDVGARARTVRLERGGLHGVIKRSAQLTSSADERDELRVFEGGDGRGRAALECIEDFSETERFALFLACHLLVIETRHRRSRLSLLIPTDGSD
ncbi:MAG: hypothetical protein DWI48_04970 [Chloroflexi bacterium]|nr:MAG: hypothetical protein DWI48_04970 [Chloroflexota bacterium]